MILKRFLKIYILYSACEQPASLMAEKKSLTVFSNKLNHIFIKKRYFII